MENNENLNFDSLTEFTYDINDMASVSDEKKAIFNGFFAKAGKVEVDMDDKKLTIENAEVGEEVHKSASAEDVHAKEKDDLKGLAEREHNA